MLRITPRGLIRSGWLLLTMLVLPFLLSACNSSDSAAPPPPVAAVQSVVLTNGVDGVVLQWDDVIGVDSYNVYRSTSPSVAVNSTNLLVSNATAPYTDRTVVHGDTYYYVVTAVQGGRLSAPSPEVGATFGATDPATTPQNLTVSPTEEVTNSLTLQWGDVAGATSYNIYYSTTPGVTALTGTKITDAVAPFIHNGLSGQTTYYYVVTAVIGGVERHESAEVSGVPRGPASGGGEDEGYGNNLSFPLIFANGYGLTGAKITNAAAAPQYEYNTGLRPTATETPPTFPYFDPASAYSMGGVTYYKQKTASTWQAQWADGSATVQHVTINWGDALNSRSHTISSPVRIEAAFYRDVTSSPMTGYNMTSLYGSERNEMFGTDTTTYVSNSAAVFEPNVRMKLEKLVAQGGAVDTSVPAQLNQAIWEGYSATEEGGSDELGLSAEVNTGGSVVYGFTWMLQNSGLGAAQLQGWWRITVSLDPVATINGVDVPNNVSIDAVDAGDANTAIVSPTEATIEIQVR